VIGRTAGPPPPAGATSRDVALTAGRRAVSRAPADAPRDAARTGVAGAAGLAVGTALGAAGTAAADPGYTSPELCEASGGVVVVHPIEPPPAYGFCLGGVFDGWLVIL
jgi:hypothetical protein